MRLIEPSVELMDEIDGQGLLKSIEKAGRTCYKSEANITDNSAKAFVQKIIDNGHESVLEHEKITVKVICDRGVSHEIVRHRIASYSQESTRYCNYANERFGMELTFITPCFWKDPQYAEALEAWKKAMESSEKYYMELIRMGAKAEEARSVLPNSLKTEIVMTMNLREWRHFFRLRTSSKAHPQMRQIALMILKEFQNKIPVVFDDFANC